MRANGQRIIIVLLLLITGCMSIGPKRIATQVTKTSSKINHLDVTLPISKSDIRKNENIVSLHVVYSTSFLVVLAASLVAFSPAPALIHALGTTSATKVLSILSASAALMEIMLSPALGSLMDSLGRKTVFLASLIALATANAIVSVQPTVVTISMAKVINSFAVGLFFIASQTIMSDSTSSQPERMSSAIGIQLSLTSLGFMVGAVAAGRVAEQGLRITYGISTAVALLALIFGITLTETLAPANRYPVERNVMKLIQSPLTAARIFRHKKLRVLVILLLLSSMPTFMGDIFQIFTKAEWGLEAKNYSTFLALFGIIGISGNIVGSMLVRKIGNKKFTILSTLSSLCVPVGITLCQYRGLQIGAVIGFLASAQKMGITAALISEGAKIGVPQGELAGERSSVIALLKVVSPIWYSLLYVQGKKVLGINTLPFLFNIGLSFLAFTICIIHL